MRTSAPTVFLNLSTGWAHYLHNTLRYFVNAAALTAGTSDDDSQKLKLVDTIAYLRKTERYNPASVELDQYIVFLHGLVRDLCRHGFSFARLYHMTLSRLSTQSSYSTGHRLFFNKNKR